MAARAKKKTTTHHKRATHHANDDVARLSRRPVWEGHLKLSLVSCPVELYRATTRANDISFHLLNPKTNNRIRMVATDPDEGPVERAGLVKGYEIEKNRYVVIKPEELDEVKLETTRTLEVERFVEAREIDPLFLDDAFFLLPARDADADAYVVIRDAMAKAKTVALGRLVMHTRERLLAVETRGKGLIAHTLHMNDEVIDAESVFRRIPSEKPDPKMIDIAEKIIGQLTGPFEPEEFRDRYETALRELIRRKERGQKPIHVEPPSDTNVIDLMDALQKSLKSKKRASR